ncbi:TPA: 6-phosphogluconate dehydrogenase (decarboxylating) [Patescibacteria group bacterium]|uniref:6-phosphogluconate dehydrogenase, decarboxylating n=1 Tax=Candidatus Gottesmanbacteria bacterium GW2011_GWA1_43_11 TaxID=1618436 RepID=A0A0G1CIC1_9BACT|nr:MAG: 6-phosphogluconate dehydrogenase, decarboxylating [Candidatus Gottesmanbacteria bacterium GW2011_GWA1_43_11]HCS79425.1 6-phosphogluconate dehydrogenase (decarboxylating) [Patescibacteria group bacterium]
MHVTIIGLGRIGKNVCLHLLEQGVEVVAYNRSRDDVDEVVAKGAVGAYSLEEIFPKLSFGSDKPVVVLLYVPAKVVDEVLLGVTPPNPLLKRGGTPSFREGGLGRVSSLISIFPKGSIVIDGGNSFFKDSQRRYELLKAKGLHFLDMGTSGGIEGARNGACLMVGGDKKVYEQVAPLLSKISQKDGFGYVGPAGSGHFVKMVHNAVEYGMMGALAEGLNIIQKSKIKNQNESGNDYRPNLQKIARIWAHGSIVSGHLMNMAVRALEKDLQLQELSGQVPKGETEAEMEWLESLGQPMPVISAARKERVDSRKNPSFIGKVIAALRREFGGHAVKNDTL